MVPHFSERHVGCVDDLLVRGCGTMLALLDLETRLFHAEADQSWVDLLVTSDSPDQYAGQLAVAYGFEAPFEIARRYTPGLAQLITVPLHERSGLIVRALLELGWSAEDIANIPSNAFSLFAETPEALAWMYVVERSALIQADVRQKLASRIKDVASATTCLAAYDSTASARRAELGIALDHLCVSEKVYKRVIHAARIAFGALIEWQHAAQPGLRSVG